MMNSGPSITYHWPSCTGWCIFEQSLAVLFAHYQNHLADASGREVDSSSLPVYTPREVA